MQHRSSYAEIRVHHANEDRIMWRRPFDDQARIRFVGREPTLWSTSTSAGAPVRLCSLASVAGLNQPGLASPPYNELSSLPMTCSVDRIARVPAARAPPWRRIITPSMRHWSRRNESASVGSTARHFVGRNETTWSATSVFRQRRVSDAGSATRGAALGGSIVSWPPPRINVRIRSMRANTCAESAVEAAVGHTVREECSWRNARSRSARALA